MLSAKGCLFFFFRILYGWLRSRRVSQHAAAKRSRPRRLLLPLPPVAQRPTVKRATPLKRGKSLRTMSQATGTM